MKTIHLITIAVTLLTLTPCCEPQCGDETHSQRARYLVITPTDGLGSVLDKDSYYVKQFVDLQSNTDKAGLFGHHNKGPYDRNPYFAPNIPYGRYRVVLQSKSGSDSFGRIIEVCRKEVFVEVPNHFARVHIVFLSETLNTLEAANSAAVEVMQFRNSDDDTEMASLFKGLVAEQVPYGHYDMNLLVPFYGVDRHVDVLQPDVWIFIGDPAYPYGDTRASYGPINVIRGELKNIPDNERPVFLTMSGVTFPYMINSTVTDTGAGSGTFSFLGVNPYAVYMLYTMGKSGILDAREFDVRRESKIVIDLAHPNPPKIDDAP